MARPSKFTDTRCRIILDALADGQTYQVAATMAGVSAGTLSGWLKDEEKLEFLRSVKLRRLRLKRSSLHVCMSMPVVIGRLLSGYLLVDTTIGVRFRSKTSK